MLWTETLGELWQQHQELNIPSRTPLSVLDLAMQKQQQLWESLRKKGFKNRTRIWALVNTIKNNGVKIILDEDNYNTSRQNFP
ncbi:hypothetical protein Peur_037048 [Populus x canadensis]